MEDVVEEKSFKLVPFDDTKEVKMPRGDRTGPNGEGPMTGRRMGICATDNNNMNLIGRGRGRGFRSGAGATNSRILEKEIKALKDQLNALEKRFNK